MKVLYNKIMNDAIFDFFGENKTLDKISDILLIVMLAIVAGFALSGLVQLIKRKSLKKVDSEIVSMIPSLLLLVAIYFIFDKVWILNYRPVLVNGVAEASFPSTHTLITVTVLGITMMTLPKYVKNRKQRILIDVLALIAMVVMAFLRVASGMHWMTDVLGGIVFGFDLALIYGGVLRIVKERRHE